MLVAACDTLGFLPSPPSGANNGASQLLEGQLMAFTANTAVVILDVRRMQQAAVLVGLHKHPVTAVSWHPERFGEDAMTEAHLRIASGDAGGRVVVWDVHGVGPLAGLDDPWLAARGRKTDPAGKTGGVRALAWVMCSPSLLAVALQGLFVVWDPRGGGVVWRKELAADLLVTSIQVNPLDCRHLCLCGEKGSLMIMRLVDLARDKAESKTYKVDMSASKPGSPIKCMFPVAPNLLFVLLARELVVFDLEYGQPEASFSLASSRPAFKDILGAFGHAAVGKDISQPGIDLLFCSHQDGSISRWKRAPEQLSYTLLGFHALLPPASRITNNQTLQLLCCCAAPWRRDVAKIVESATIQPARHQTTSFTVDAVPATDCEYGQQQPLQRAAEGSPCEQRGGESSEAAGGTAERGQCETSLLVVCVTENGQAWQWDVPMDSTLASEAPGPGLQSSPAAPTPRVYRKFASLEPRARRPELLGMLQSLAHSISTLSACPCPVAVAPILGLPREREEAVAVLAAVTAGGSIELVTLQQGLLQPLQPHVSISLGAHKELVRGVRWLGSTSRLASFSSEKISSGFRNTLLLTDVRNRASISFRDVVSESAPMLGIRASPLGRYLLVLLRGAPSEIWLVGGSGRPSRSRVLDLPFTAVEWAIPNDTASPMEPMPAPKRTFWQRSPLSKERSLSGYTWDNSEGSGEVTDADSEEQPEERLAFALADGRVGVLSVKGRKVTDTKPKRPVWAVLNAPDSVPTAVAAWGHIVILGHEDGILSRWDTRTGRTMSLVTNQGTIRRLHFSPPASCELQREGANQAASSANARIAVLFSSGSFGVWELDSSNELRASPVSPASGSRLGKIIDLSWASLPPPVGPGCVLALATEDGSLAFIDAVNTNEQQPSQRRRMAAFRGLLAGAFPAPNQVSLPPPAPHGSALLLANPWRLLLRLLLQSGVPAEHLRSFCKSASGQEQSVTEEMLWKHLPSEMRAAWDRMPHRISSAEAQDLSLLAADQELRTLLRQRTASLVAQSSDAEPVTLAAAEEQAASSRSKEFPLGMEEAGTPSGRPAEYSTPANAQMLHAAPKGTAFSSLKARMSKMAKGGQGRTADGQEELAGQLASIRVSTEEEARQPAPLPAVLTALAGMRAGGHLLFLYEWAAYQAALSSNSCAERMAVAAEVTSSHEEVVFWRALPSVLAMLRVSLPPSFTQPASSLVLYTDPQTGISAYRRTSEADPQGAADGGSRQDNPPPTTILSEGGAGVVGGAWNEAVQIAEARERIAWHEKMSRANLEQSEALQERRVLEYITVGDYQTAVGFLLASTPDRSARYYRDALCTLALAAASAGARPAPQDAVEAVSGSLHIQVAKVITAHAATVGDTLIGVPLLCSAGLPAEAVTLLQEGGLWQHAATLAAHALSRPQQAAALERWAAQIHQEEGSLWRAVGVLTAAGALRNAVLLLRRRGLPDCAAAYVEAATAAGFGTASPASDAGGLENWHHTGSTATRQRSFFSTHGSSADSQDSGSLTADFAQYCIDVLQHL